MKKEELNKKIRKAPEYLAHKVLDIDDYDLNDASIEDDSCKFRRKVISEGFKIRQLYVVYYNGWEMDNFACIAEKDDEIYWIMTNHGKLEIQIK